MDDLIGQTMNAEEDETTQATILDGLRETIGYVVFTSTIIRFMPENSAILFEKEMIEEMLSDLEYDTYGLEDHIGDLVLVHFHYEGDGSSSVLAMSLDDFFESMNINDSVKKGQTEVVLREGKVIKFKFQNMNDEPDEDADDETETLTKE